MRTDEEKLALELRRALTAALPTSDVSASGAGVHWECTARSAQRITRIACFASDGAEYGITFEEVAAAGPGAQATSPERHARLTGSTLRQDEAIAAVRKWLEGATLERLLDCFAFVDRGMRHLRRLQADTLALAPELVDLSWALDRNFADQALMTIARNDRRCMVDFYGHNPQPDAAFEWDEFPLFRFRVLEVPAFARVVKMWLLDQAAPSRLHTAFPWIELSPVARYYEEGRPIEGEFIESWRSVTRFYEDLEDRGADAVAFVAELKAAGYDRKFRAGVSLFTLMLSRSRRHGLRGDQPYVAADCGPDGLRIRARLGKSDASFVAHRGDARIEAVLQELADFPVT